MRQAQHIDDADLHRLDFEFTAEELFGCPFDAGVAGAQPDAVVIDEGDVAQSRCAKRIALEARDADHAERSDAAAIDLGDEERAAGIAGDPVAQADACGGKRQHGHDHADCEAPPEGDFPAFSLCHQNACPMEI